MGEEYRWVAGKMSRVQFSTVRTLVFKAQRCPALQAPFPPRGILTFTRTLLLWLPHLCDASFPQYRRIYFSQLAPRARQSDAKNADTHHRRINEWKQWKKNICQVRCWSLTIFFFIITMLLRSKVDAGAHPEHHEVNVLGLLTNTRYNKELLNPTP